jgi:lipopolysaccharide transport system permease protein
LLLFAASFGELPSWHLAFAPVVVLGGALFAFGVSLILSGVNVHHRDIRNLLPLGLQLWLFLSPIAYPLDNLSEPWITLFSLNPLMGFIDGFRWTALDGPPPTTIAIASSVIATIVSLAIGLVYFARAERVFADVV